MRFIDNGDTITDTATGLEWTKAETKATWQAGQDWCAALRVGGHDDWRMPTIQELLTLVDYERSKPAADPVLGLRSNYYWSSSTYQDSPDDAWIVTFDVGYTLADYKTYNYYVRAVRSGSRPFDHLPDEALRQAEARRDAAEGALATLRDEVRYLKEQIAKVRAVVK